MSITNLHSPSKSHFKEPLLFLGFLGLVAANLAIVGFAGDHLSNRSIAYALVLGAIIEFILGIVVAILACNLWLGLSGKADFELCATGKRFTAATALLPFSILAGIVLAEYVLPATKGLLHVAANLGLVLLGVLALTCFVQAIRTLRHV